MEAKSAASRYRAEVTTTAGSSSGATSDSLLKSIKLPEIKSRTFSGKLVEWPPFYDFFQSTIGNNPSLDKCAKLQYLMSFLRAEAADAVSGFDILAQNYGPVLAKLVGLYGNERLLNNAIIQAIVGLPKVVNEDYEGLRNLVFSFQSKIRTLEGKSRPCEDAAWIFLPIIQEKLPQAAAAAWEKDLARLGKAENNNATLKDFDAFINVFLATEAKCWGKKPKDSKAPGKGKTEAFTALVAQEGGRDKGKGKGSKKKLALCPLCDERVSHPFYRCEKGLLMTVEQRIRKMGNRCLACAQVHTAESPCASKFVCKIDNCGLRHSIIFHK